MAEGENLKHLRLSASVIFANLLAATFISGCSATFMTVDNADKFKHNDKYDKAIKVKQLTAPATAASGGVSAGGVATTNPGTPPVPSASGDAAVHASGHVANDSGATATGVSSNTTPTDAAVESEKVAANGKKAHRHDRHKKNQAGKPVAVTGEAAEAHSGDPEAEEIVNASRPKLKNHRQPETEDEEGFNGRRPIVDPFHVGEKISMKMMYFGIRAGDISMETKPFVEVNGRKSYHFEFIAHSNPSFSSFYAIEDIATAFMDFDLLRPFNYEMHVKETKQLKEVRQYFDWAKLENHLWERKVTKESGTEEKDKVWEVPPFTHNVFSGLYYMRVFKLYPGKHIQFNVVDEEHTLLVTADVLKRETIDTDVGPMKTLVLKPQISMAGVFKPIGDVFFYVTDDDRKALVQIESKVKIGSIKGYLTGFTKGQ
jgi:hypothetical protein